MHTAALAGVEPWNYTLRQLAWQARAAQEEAWARTAWLGHLVVNVLSSGRRVTADEVNPLKLASKRVSDSQLIERAKQARSKLPDTLTNDEIERRWRSYAGT